MLLQVFLVACLASCLASSLALSEPHHYQPWFGYQTAPAYRYQQYYPGPHHTFHNYQDRRVRHHPVAAVPVLPEVTLESSQETGPPPPPLAQPVFSPASDLLLPVISPIQGLQYTRYQL